MWGTPYEPGYRVLDGLRAALSSEQLGLSADSPIGLWGYSGGGLATAWAAEMSRHVRAGAEHRRRGARLTGRQTWATPSAASTAASTPGCPRWWSPRCRTPIPTWTGSSRSTPPTTGKAMLLQVETMTTAHAVLRLIGMDMGKLVDRPLEEILDMPEVQEVFDSIKLGTAVPTPPVLIVQAVHDRIVAVDDIDELADTYGSGGAAVTYHRDMFSEHMLLHPMSAPMTLRWLTDRFAGKPLSDNLIRTKWPTLLNPMTYVGMARLARIVAKVVTGRTVERRPL